MHKFKLTFLGLLLAALCSSAWADEYQEAMQLKPNPKNGAEIYPLCATCHMPSGWGKRDGTFPVIAGQHPNVILKQLSDIRSRKRENPTMFPFSDSKTIGGVQAMADVAAYISAMPADPHPGQGPGKDLAEGIKIYQQECALCHGPLGEGDNDKLYPRIRGQHFGYLMREIRFIKDGFRKNANPEMVRRLKTLTPEQLEAVADYVSRIGS
jgi:cytochrome c553